MSRSQTEEMGAARQSLGLSIWEVWFDYFRIGGSLPPAMIDRFLRDLGDIDDHDFDLVVHALNERFIDRNENHPLAYSSELPPVAP